MEAVRVGIDMGGTQIKIGLVKDGHLLDSRKIEASSHLTLENRLLKIEEEIKQLIYEYQVSIRGIGIAFPGIINNKENKILSRYVKYPNAHTINLDAYVRDKWKVPFALENDARAALIGEWQFGAGKNCDNLVLVTIGTGIGSAAMVDGKLLRGPHHLAGNLGGHMTLNLDGHICNCGNIGCLEAEASTWALKENKHKPEFINSSLSSGEINFHEIFKKAADGDDLAIIIRDRSLKAWSLGIINLIHAYDPERVVIGGGVMNSGEIILPYVREMVQKHSWIMDGEINITAAEHMEYAGILGVSYLLKEQEIN